MSKKDEKVVEMANSISEDMMNRLQSVVDIRRIATVADYAACALDVFQS